MTNLKIKFWDKKLSVMWEPIELKKLLSYLLFQSMPNSDGYHALRDHFNEMIPLYSTGLTGKNGVEIYEGDVVTDDPDRLSKGVVEFSSGAFLFSDGIQNDIPLGLHNDYLEVIGNIYDKP